MALVAAAVVALDQVTKWWAASSLSHRSVGLLGGARLALARNRAGAFSLGGSFVPVMALAAVALVLLVVVRGEAVRRAPVAVALGLVVGGAFGNLADRLFRAPGPLHGAVVDFVDLRWWPVFNLADAAITCGCLMLVLVTSRAGQRW